jgi:hypothetical protein
MSPNLIEHTVTYRMIAKGADSNTNLRQHSLGRYTAGHGVQGNANAVAIAGFALDNSALIISFFPHYGHAQLDEGGMGGSPSIVKISDKGIASFSLIVGVSSGAPCSRTGRHP